MVGCSVLISPESIQINGRRITRHGGELLPGDEPAALSQGDQLRDPMAIPGNSKRLPVFDGIHDLP